MPDFERVAQSSVRDWANLRALLQPLVMTASDRCRPFRIARKQFQECFDSLGIEAEVGRQLPENRAKLVAETENAGSQEVGKGDLDFSQPSDMRDEAWAFVGEHVIRSHGGPSSETIRSLQGIELISMERKMSEA
jgi:hypothetical protein